MNIIPGDGTKVRLIEETSYPFEESVRFTMNMEKKVTFPFYLRVPGWCKKGSVTINNQQVSVNAISGSYIRIEREWVDGDYGPLTFSFKIKEEYKKLSSTPIEIKAKGRQWKTDPPAGEKFQQADYIL